MDARRYLQHLMDSRLEELDRGGPASVYRYELRGAAQALMNAGLLEPEELSKIMEEFARRLGGARDLGESRVGIAVEMAPEDRADQSEHPRLEGVHPIVQNFSPSEEDEWLAVSLERWTDGFVFRYVILGLAVDRAEGLHASDVRHWEAWDDRDNTYRMRAGGFASFAAGVYAGEALFFPRVADDATRLVVRRHDGQTQGSALVDLR